MKKYFLILPIAYLLYFITIKVIPNINHTKLLMETTKYKSHNKNKWPWFGLNLYGVNYTDKYLALKTNNVKLELNIFDALFNEFKVHKIIIEQPKIEMTGSLNSLKSNFQNSSFPFDHVYGDIKLNNIFKISIHGAKITFNNYILENANIHTTDIQPNNPFSINIEGTWGDHPLTFSALVTKSGRKIKLENTHLTFKNMSKQYGMSYIKINSDIDIVGDDIIFSNLAIMSPEARLQGEAELNLKDFTSRGSLELPTAPCKNVIHNLNIKLDNPPEFLNSCNAKLKWLNSEINFSVAGSKITATGNLNSSNNNSILNITGGNIKDILTGSNERYSLSSYITEWFPQIIWQNLSFGKLKLKQVICNKSSKMYCKAKIDENAEFDAIFSNIKEGVINARNISPAMLFQAMGINNNQITGIINVSNLAWDNKNNIQSYRGQIYSDLIKIKDWPLAKNLNNGEASQKLEINSSNLEAWQHVNIYFSGLNKIININNFKARTDGIVNANGIIDLSSGAISLEIQHKSGKYTLIGKLPESAYLIKVLPGTDLNRRPSD